MKRFAAVILLSAVAASGGAHAGERRKACKAELVQDLVGKPRDGKLERDAKKRAGARMVRWIPMGSAVTMDYRPDRLNLRLGPDGTITGVNCG